MRKLRTLILTLSSTTVLAVTTVTPAVVMTAHEQLAHEIFADLVAANTAPSGGNDTRAAVAGLVKRLRDAGFGDEELLVLAKQEPLQNLVVRYRSPNATREPVLMMAHIDVVEALPEDWSMDPFVLTEKDDYYYGRGTTDNKAGAAMLVANLIRLRHEDFQPNRDLIIMLTADEESTGAAADWLVTEHRALVDAAFALNTDGGMVIMRNDAPAAFIVQTSEKVYVSFELEALDPGGHSSLPRADDAISRLARTLVDLQSFRFPVDLNETTEAFFTRWSELAPPDESALIDALLEGERGDEFAERLAEVPYYNALARTTCVPTGLAAGHAENALPQTARATVNCRVLPQSSPDAIRAVIEDMAQRYGVSVRQIAMARPSPPSPLDATVMEPVTEVARTLWPGIAVIPEMSTGATDGLFVRNAGIPVYGVSAIAEDPDDVRAHGQDERIRVDSYVRATEYWYRLIKAFSGS